MMQTERVLVVTNGDTFSHHVDDNGFHHLTLDLNTGHDSSGIEPIWHQVFEATPPDVQAIVDWFDPNGEAVVIPWRLRRSVSFAGRPVYGPRHPSAIALEDKTRFVELLDDLGIPQAPGAVTVRMNFRELKAAAEALDQGLGTVWSGDSATVSASGGKYVRHVRDERDAVRAARFFALSCEAVRVAPFVEGVASGIHALVNRDHTMVFRPTEQIVMRSSGKVPFDLIGSATLFDPHPFDREAYREIARSIGDEMHRRLGYEGAISVDAILSEQGWVVHDLNPRPSAGLAYLGEVIPELPIHLLHHVLAEGDASGLNWPLIERQICAHADLHRVALASMSVRRGPTMSRVVRVHTLADEHIDVYYDPAEVGGKLTLRVDAAAGDPVAPKVALAINAASEYLGLGVSVQAHKSVRDRLTAPTVHREGQEVDLELTVPDDLIAPPEPAQPRLVLVPAHAREPEHVITLEREAAVL